MRFSPTTTRVGVGSLIATATLLVCATAPRAQVADAPDDTNSGIPINYTESKVGTFTLPTRSS